MSYKLLSQRTDLRVDIFTPQQNSSGSVGSPWHLGPSIPSNRYTDVGIGGTNSTQMTLNSGSSYYLEGAPQADNTNSGTRGSLTWQFYDVTNSQWIGSDAFQYTAGASGASARQGRKACAALILDSEITTSMIVELRIKAIAGTNWNFTITTPNLGLPSSFYWHTGYPTVRVWQLPS